MSRLYIGFITYGGSTAKYLPYFLPSLTGQSFTDYKLLAVDNSEADDRENAELIKQYCPEAEIDRPGENLGFARAYNRMIRKAIREGGELFLMVNPDMTLESNAVHEMVKEMDEKDIGSIAPKILRWDFDRQKKTAVIDSCGIKLLRGLRFIDLGQGENDGEGFSREMEILGPSGAAGMYKIRPLEDVAYKHKDGTREYFDELMFMYKEDCDLVYRLYLAGYRAQYIPQAVIYHDRTAAGQGKRNLKVASNRKNKSKRVKEWSFLNQNIIFLKHWRHQGLFDRLMIIWFEFKMFAFLLIFEQYLLAQVPKLFQLRKEIKQRIYNP